MLTMNAFAVDGGYALLYRENEYSAYRPVPSAPIFPTLHKALSARDTLRERLDTNARRSICAFGC